MPRSAVTALTLITAACASQAGKGTSRMPTDQELVQRLRRLPNLLELARAREDAARPERDVYVIQAELAEELSAQKRPYVRAMPYRSPPRPCSTGAHPIPRVELTVVNPAGPRRLLRRTTEMTFEEAHLHEVEFHGAALTEQERTYLEALP